MDLRIRVIQRMDEKIVKLRIHRCIDATTPHAYLIQGAQICYDNNVACVLYLFLFNYLEAGNYTFCTIKSDTVHLEHAQRSVVGSRILQLLLPPS